MKFLATIVLLFGLCTFPRQIAWILLQFGNDINTKKLPRLFSHFRQFCTTFTRAHSFIYRNMSKQFRRDYMKIIPIYLNVQYVFDATLAASLVTSNIKRLARSKGKEDYKKHVQH